MPAFYQTVWFKSFLACLAVLCIWFLYALRVSFIARRYRLLLHERSAERERIARDLHDTLLQGMQGILLQLELWARNPNLSAVQRGSASKIEDKMRSMLIEGRDTIGALRQAQDHHADLIAGLLLAGNEAAALDSRFSLRLASGPRDLLDDACEEVLAVAREAVLNAFRHAEAEAVWATIDYAPHAADRVRKRQRHRGIALAHRRAAEGGPLGLGWHAGACSQTGWAAQGDQFPG